MDGTLSVRDTCPQTLLRLNYLLITPCILSTITTLHLWCPSTTANCCSINTSKRPARPLHIRSNLRPLPRTTVLNRSHSITTAGEGCSSIVCCLQVSARLIRAFIIPRAVIPTRIRQLSITCTCVVSSHITPLDVPSGDISLTNGIPRALRRTLRGRQYRTGNAGPSNLTTFDNRISDDRYCNRQHAGD